MLWVLVVISLLFQACASTPTPPLDQVASANLLNQSKERYQKCLLNNQKGLSVCSVEKKIFETNLKTHQASFGVEKSLIESPKNFNHILNWKTTWGKVSTGFTGRNVFGRYPDYAGILKGSIDDEGSLAGYWFQITSRHRCGYSLDDTYYWGTFRFDNFTRGKFFGKWAYCDAPSGSGGLWDGERIPSETEK